MIIQFSTHVLVCLLNCTVANYKTSTNKYNTDDTHTNNTTKKHKKQKLNRLPKICFTDIFYLLCTLITAKIMIVILIIMITIITQCSKFQLKICFNKVIRFLKKSASRNTTFAAETHLAAGEFLLVAKNKEWFLKLHKGTLIPVACKRDGQHFRSE